MAPRAHSGKAQRVATLRVGLDFTGTGLNDRQKFSRCLMNWCDTIFVYLQLTFEGRGTTALCGVRGLSMGKGKKADKSKKPKKHKHSTETPKRSKAPALTLPLVPLTGGPSYEDGVPLDRVTYLEAKLILKPEPFTSVDSFRDFGKIVQKVAKRTGVGFITAPEASRRPEIREITFGDTSDFHLYNNAFILRRRIRYMDGFPAGDPEIVFKYRHPDEVQAAAMDVRPHISGKYRIKFKAEALPLKDRAGGYRILYSHNCQFGLSQMHEEDQTSMSTLARVFPGLAAIKKSDDEHICRPAACS